MSPSKLNSSQPVLLVICVRMYVYVFCFVWGGVVGEGERERERFSSVRLVWWTRKNNYGSP